MIRVCVLVSGEGSNLAALIGQLHGHVVRIVGVASDRSGPPALTLAEADGIPTASFVAGEYETRVDRDVALADWVDGLSAELVVTAGYMSILDAAFIRRFPDRIVNVHPSLLPAFPGIRAVEQALDYGVKVSGVTVHLVDEGVDTGRILLQEAVSVPRDATPGSLHAALQEVEHRLLPQAVKELAVQIA